MRIAVVGCGYVADFYMQTLANHPWLRLCGVFDAKPERLAAFAAYHGVPTYPSFEALLADPAVEIVLNLTNPASHYAVSRACLEAGKHVYSEKPLALDLGEAEALVALAAGRGLRVAAAPCTLLGETAQTLWRALRDKRIGDVRLVYAELDDGMVHKSALRLPPSVSGAPWPAEDEFEVGCTFEHAGYYLTWLIAFFGPVRRVHAFASRLIPDKGMGDAVPSGPDFSVGCLEFDEGVVARLTCSIVAPHNHSLRVIGEDGMLMTREAWDYASPVWLRRSPAGFGGRVARRLEREVAKYAPSFALSRTLPPVRRPAFRRPAGYPMDFARGVAELAASILEDRPCRLSAELALHVTEVTSALQHPERFARPHVVRTSVTPVEPMPWAEGRSALDAAAAAIGDVLLAPTTSGVVGRRFRL